MIVAPAVLLLVLCRAGGAWAAEKPGAFADSAAGTSSPCLPFAGIPNLYPGTGQSGSCSPWGGVGQTLTAPITRRELVSLPLAGRDYTDLLILSPGVSPKTVTGNLIGPPLPARFQVGGGTEYSGSFAVGQADNTSRTTYGSAITPSLERIGEVQILTAGSSWVQGGGSYSVDVVLKSGSEKFSGSLFEFMQHDQLNAGNSLSGLEPPHLRRSQFGGSFSGPLRRGRLFFSGGYEGISGRGAEPAITQTATAQQREGIFSAEEGGDPVIRDPLTGKPFPGNRIPSSRFSPFARYFLDRIWPLPNFQTQFYRQNAVADTRSHQAHLQLDYLPGAADRISIQISGQALTFRPLAAQALLSPRNEKYDHLLGGVHYTRILDSRRTNLFSLVLRHDDQPVRSSADGSVNPFAGQVGLNLGEPAGSGLPMVIITGKGFSGRTGQWDTPEEHSGNTFQVRDFLSWVQGNHRFGFGLEAKRFQDNEREDSAGVGQFSFNGRYSGSGLADFFLGLPNQVDFAPELGRLYFRNSLWSAFLQDHWNLRRNLAISLGLRYEYLSWPVERYNRMATSYPQLGRQVVVSSSTGHLPERLDPVALDSFPAGTFISSRQAGLPRSLRFPDRNNWAPQFGLAFRYAGRQVLRAGYRIDYIKNSQSVFNERNAGLGLPIRINRTVLNPNPRYFDILQPFAGRASAVKDTIESSVYLDPNFRLAYMQNWWLQWEGGFFWKSELRVGYAGSRMVHGKQTWNWNQSPDWPNRNDRFEGYSEITALTSGADSFYHALQAGLQRQSAQGWTGRLNYTWSKNLANWVPDSEPASIWVHDPAMQWGRSRWDRRHAVTGSFIGPLPLGKIQKWLGFLPWRTDRILGGWEIAGIFQVLSGKPLTILSSLAKANLSVSGNVPADRLSPGTLAHPNSGRWFDPMAFATPPADRPGNAGYGVLDGPGWITEDIALYRAFRIREGARLQFRLEAYNALNHVNLGDPIVDVDNWSHLGKILTSGPALHFQLALRLDF